VRTILILIALLSTTAPATAAQFFGTDRLVRVHIDDGAVPGATDEVRILDQQGDFVETREIFVDHDGAGAYSNHALAGQQSGIGGAAVTFIGSVDASGTSDAGGPDSTAETFLEVDFTLDVSESFTLRGDYDLVLGNGSVSLQVDLLGGGVSFVSASSDDLFEDHGALDYAGTLEPGNYTLAIRLFSLGENLPSGSNLGGGSVALRNFALLLEPVVVPEPGTALLVGLGLLAATARRNRTPVAR
jgi:PEP-CTERM motif